MASTEKNVSAYLYPSIVPVFVGIDIAPKMIELTKKTGFYTHSFCCSVEEILRGVSESTSIAGVVSAERVVREEVRVTESSTATAESKSELEERNAFDLVLSADTFIYVGALSDTFFLISKSLKSGGIFAFSGTEYRVLLHSFNCHRSINTEGSGSESPHKSTEMSSEPPMNPLPNPPLYPPYTPSHLYALQTLARLSSGGSLPIAYVKQRPSGRCDSVRH